MKIGRNHMLNFGNNVEIGNFWIWAFEFWWKSMMIFNARNKVLHDDGIKE